MADPNLLFLGTEFGLWTSVDGGGTWAGFKPDNFPAVAVRDIAVQPRDNDLVIATHGRGIWIVDDLAPLRELTPQTLVSEAAMLAGRPAQQRIEGNGGWPEGDAAYAGDNPADGAVITYYLRSRAVIGKLKIEILDASGAVVDTVPASKRKGLNRVVWSMRSKPPEVPPAASIAGAAAIGPRFLPGTYTVRLTRGTNVLTLPLTVGLDRRAAYTVADRTAQFDEANRVKVLFGRMSVLVGSIAQLRGEAAAYSAHLAPADPLRADLAHFSDQANALRKEVVATTEGGAITGEQRLREDAADVYGAIMSSEAAPPNYLIQRVGVIDRELTGVEQRFRAFTTTSLPALNDELKAKALPALTIAATAPRAVAERGGPVDALFRAMIGTRLRGTLDTGTQAERDDNR
jgi:hypothetical protein